MRPQMRALILYPATFALFLGGIFSFPLLVLLRPFHRRWGAADREARDPLPGDSEVPGATYQATRAVTIAAVPESVWPWIVQMGYRRAGWYGFDQFDNDGVPSATRIVPGLQSLRVGEVIAEEGLTVKSIDPGRSLVLAFSHSRTVWVFNEGIWPKCGSSSLAYVLVPVDRRRTRLVVRMRFKMRLASLPALWWPFFEVGDFLNTRRQVVGIKRWAEGLDAR